MFIKNKYGLRNNFIPQTSPPRSEENKVDSNENVDVKNAPKLSPSISATSKFNHTHQQGFQNRFDSLKGLRSVSLHIG